ncbi:hypothetical protein [[Mycoplasma] testudinis]|uniref:hypothetical protein n=1 Tax=[Mycoplasma] testudinis TaxID=33924 RepID=UPI0006991E34|nr:hypothetical protein [[Mycoplasma] testudinis]
MNKLKIRHTTIKDFEEMVSLYRNARRFMILNNNPNQWGNTYPDKKMLFQDISHNVSYVIESDGVIVGAFVFMIGVDLTYRVIKNGKWNSDQTYGVIHRLTGSTKAKGVAKACFDFCLEKINYLRIDTHADNKIMQEILHNYGFKKCGIIFVADETERIAYDFLRNN